MALKREVDEAEAEEVSRVWIVILFEGFGVGKMAGMSLENNLSSSDLFR